MRSLLTTLVLALRLCAGTSGQAQTWPAQPVKIIVNFAPGGAADHSLSPLIDASPVPDSMLSSLNSALM